MSTLSSVKSSNKIPTRPVGLLVAGLAVIAILAAATNRLAHWSTGGSLPGDIGKVLEYPLWAAILGLAGNIIFSITRTKTYLKPALRTELFMKIGLILLGVRVNLPTILSAGFGGLVQAVIMITSVFFFTWWLAGKFRLPPTLRAVMATAISVCGVSAAIAAAGAVLAKREEIAYITALVIVTALPLMILAPPAAMALGLSPEVAGAWFGGNIDTTAAVVGAGTMYGPRAQEIAAIVKMSQNALIGVVAFLLAFYFVTSVEKQPGQRPSLRVIWDRFPKFVLGFVAMSLLASLGFFSQEQISTLKAVYEWAFALAFVSIGLELSGAQIKKMSWRPVIVYLIATVFNTVLALGAAQIIFGYLFVG